MPVRSVGGEHAERDGDGQRDEHRVEHQHQRHRQPLLTRSVTGHVERRRPAEVAGEQLLQPLQVLDRDRLVEAPLLADLLELLARGAPRPAMAISGSPGSRRRREKVSSVTANTTITSCSSRCLAYFERKTAMTTPIREPMISPQIRMRQIHSSTPSTWSSSLLRLPPVSYCLTQTLLNQTWPGKPAPSAELARAAGEGGLADALDVRPWPGCPRSPRSSAGSSTAWRTPC